MSAVKIRPDLSGTSFLKILVIQITKIEMSVIHIFTLYTKMYIWVFEYAITKYFVSKHVLSLYSELLVIDYEVSYLIKLVGAPARNIFQALVKEYT